ncbi:Aste57867_17960 [Aphanomyces stellatus]|uniref:Aste57867_17960 protein n=1 Tax=Aphanomyces stellatus TaxID=120398 RepID=A0A485L962_9STRA|nr:hypothetical protein As57867_017898 [Aphanomyces stellatus]VFT94700.1 Aste57867_17960 [Aphanomyces stellatus]
MPPPKLSKPPSLTHGFSGSLRTSFRTVAPSLSDFAQSSFSTKLGSGRHPVTQKGVLRRILTNCFDLVSILGVVVAVFVLYRHGVLARRQTSARVPSDWRPVGASCTLDRLGWSLSCSSREVALTDPTVWSALGTTLAASFDPAMLPLRMTTCAVGTTRGYGVVVLLFANASTTTSFPSCIPLTTESISAVAMLETAAVPDSGGIDAILVTAYVDAVNTTIATRVDVPSGSRTSVATSVVKSFLLPNGTTLAAAANQTNWPFQTAPLLPRYRATYACSSEVVVGSALAVHYRGVWSNQSLAIGWTCGHTVDNATELMVAHAIALVAMLWLVAGDLITIVWGMQGMWRGQPVVSYCVHSGLERRLAAFASLVVTRLPLLLIVDVARFYLPTSSVVFALASCITAGLIVLVGVAALFVAQRLPCPVAYQHRALRLSLPLAIGVAHVLGLVFSCLLGDLQTLYFDPMWTARPIALGLVLDGRAYPAGAFASHGASNTPVVSLLLPSYVAAVVVALGIAVAVPRLRVGYWTVRLHFFDSNSFLATEFVPAYVTALPIHERNCLRLGDKFVVRGSTLALLGYAFVKECDAPPSTITSLVKANVVNVAAAHRQDKAATVLLVSIYDLVACLLPIKPYCPVILGSIQDYIYTPGHFGITIERAKRYAPTRGATVS